MTYIKNHKKDIVIFLLLMFIVGLLQITLLAPQLNFGFTPDDWWPLAFYKYLNSDFLTNLGTVWSRNGVYTSYQVLYISVLHMFFGFNFQAYQITNLTLKALSALMLFPLILTVFRNRLLAILTTILYAMAYSPLGTLELVVRGSDFIAIIFMCIFFIVYYKVIAGKFNSICNLIMLTVLLMLGMFFSPILIYPVLVFIPLIELYLFLNHRSKIAFLNSCKRIVFIFFPFILMLILSPASVLNFTSVNAPAILDRISLGNWQLLLYPLGSLGSLFLLNDFWRLFGVVQIKTFSNYIIYLLSGPLIIFSVITLFYSYILPVVSKRRLKFFLSTLLINIVLLMGVYILAKHSESISQELRMGYDFGELYPVFLAVFIFALSFSIWCEWIASEKKNNLLLSLWLGPIFATVHIILTWIFKDYSVLFKGVHTYLSVSSIGASLFLAGTLGLIYQKIKSSFGILGKQLAFQVFILLIPVFFINKNIIDNYFRLNSYGMDAEEHEAVRGRLWNKLPDFDINQPSLFYFDAAHDYPNGRFYEESLLGRFSEIMFFIGNYPPGSCNMPVFINSNIDLLKSKIIEKDTKTGFAYVDYCGKAVFYNDKNFYAFRLIGKQPIDIKDEILEQLNIDIK